MDATTVAVDLAKSVFQLAEADDQWRIVRTHRLTRGQFERFFANRQVRLVVEQIRAVVPAGAAKSGGGPHSW